MPFSDKTTLVIFLSIALFFCAFGIFSEDALTDVISGLGAPLYVGVAGWWQRVKRI